MAISVDMTGKVTTATDVRNRPSYGAEVVGQLKVGEKVPVTQLDANWSYITNDDINGWVHSGNLKLTNNQKTRTVNISKVEQDEQIQTEEEKRLAEQRAAAVEEQLLALEEELYANADSEIVDSLVINSTNGVYGIPYQFMESVDPRLGDSNMGRKYSDKIISKMPLLCITPGTTKFMSNFSKEEKSGLFAKLTDIAKNRNTDTDINDIINKNGRYFTFEFSYSDYFEYVNPLCRVGAKFLNIQNLELSIGDERARASHFDWSRALNSNLKNTVTSQNFIGFYIDSDSANSITETFSNSTTQSQLASTVNGFSDTAKEIGFLMGAGAGVEYNLIEQGGLDEILDGIDDITNKYINGGLLKNLGTNFSTVAVGGKLLFPEIWSDSEFSRDFDISIKLRTPDADTVSWYLNIYVPLCHLIALAAGHQTDNPNGYYSPFLVRAFYKGLFNIDMGIITSMSIRKGKEAAWNIDGLPTEVDVDITIKDLYNMLSIIPGNETKHFVTNNILMDYIANTCGININKLDIERSLEIYFILTLDRFTDIPSKYTRKFQDAVDTYSYNLWDKFQNKFLI